jgi:hypothetical protein
MDTAKSVESLKAEIQKLVTDLLKSPFIGHQEFTTVSLAGVSDLYKRQIEHLGCTNVKVTAILASNGDVNIEAQFTPPPTPIEISFTVEPKKE